MYILLTQTETVTCYMTDPSSRQGGRPTTNRTATVFTTAIIWSWVPEGLNDWLTDWLTDGQLQSNSDWLLQNTNELLTFNIILFTCLAALSSTICESSLVTLKQSDSDPSSLWFLTKQTHHVLKEKWISSRQLGTSVKILTIF